MTIAEAKRIVAKRGERLPRAGREVFLVCTPEGVNLRGADYWLENCGGEYRLVRYEHLRFCDCVTCDKGTVVTSK